MVNLELFKCSPSESVLGAMKKIDKNSYGVIYVVEKNDVIIGCVTDGDIRRWIINGGDLKADVINVMNSTPIVVPYSIRDSGKEIMNEYMVDSVAVVDNYNRMVDILFIRSKENIQIKRRSLSNTTVIIMAGGKGTRLYPYTKVLPKPLIPIGDIPIIVRIMNRFEEFGASVFYLVINYHKEMIKAFLSELDQGYSMNYIEEEYPLGTAGGISLIENEFKGPVIVTNCDILIEADYNDILDYHNSSDNDLTVVSSLKNTVIPYGILHTNDRGNVVSMEEKPELSHFINTGMYIVNPEFLKWIPSGRQYNMTDLLDKMIEENKKVGMYPIGENSFLDMGEIDELKRMEERINLDKPGL